MKIKFENLKVLLVDDNPTNLKVLSSALAHYQFKLLFANKGEKAVEIAKTQIPELILLDINLPGINGFETCRQLKADPVTADISVIFLSALDDTHSKVEGFTVGGVDYVTKPFYQEEVCQRVELQLKLQAMKREILAQKQVLETQNEQLQQTTEELRAIQDQLSASLDEVTDSIRYAKRIQAGLLQSQQNLKSVFQDLFGIYQPKSIVGGDFYWYHILDEVVYLAAGDCTGHGVPGAFMTMIAIQGLHNIIVEQKLNAPLETVLIKMHELLVYMLNQNEPNAAKDGMDMVIYRYHIATKRMEYASALFPVWIIRNGELIKLPINRRPVGGADYYNQPFFSGEFQMQTNVVAYIFTDGYQDQFNSEYRKIGSRRLGNLFLEIHSLEMKEQKERILQFLQEWKGSQEQQDDIFISAVRI